MSNPENLETSSGTFEWPTRKDAFLGLVALTSSYSGEVVTNPTAYKALLGTAVISGGWEMIRMFKTDTVPGELQADRRQIEEHHDVFGME